MVLCSSQVRSVFSASMVEMIFSRMTIDAIIADKKSGVKVSDGLQLLIQLIPSASNSRVQPEKVPPVGVLGRQAANHYHRVLWGKIVFGTNSN